MRAGARDISSSGDACYWSAHGGAEVDLLVHVHGKRYGFEFKHADAPEGTRSMHSALQVLNLEHLWVVYPGARPYPIAERISTLPISMLRSLPFMRG